MALIIYDSNYGNTKKIADIIAETIGTSAKCVSIDNIAGVSLQCDLLIVGCPINAWRPTPKIAAFLKNMDPSTLAGVKAAAFDTRVDSIFSGNAAKRIASSLKKAGASIIARPEPFYVTGKEGPLADGEIEKAKTWARSLAMISSGL